MSKHEKTIENDWHWTSISAIFGFTFWTRFLTPDIYEGQWLPNGPLQYLHPVMIFIKQAATSNMI
jgi:hypothetical protein